MSQLDKIFVATVVLMGGLIAPAYQVDRETGYVFVGVFIIVAAMFILFREDKYDDR
jgi:hypothetical protein